MCELLGMSANVPTDICFSFSGLMERGGRTGPHRDGWGVAFYEGKGCRAFHDPLAGCDSKVAGLVKDYSIKSRNVICHIRKATHGRVCLENTHPFMRELWGRNWAFAHNGKLKGVKKLKLEFYRPIGSTDSEHAFCWMLDQLRRRFPVPPKGERALWRLVRQLCQELDGMGIFNILLSDSINLYCHCGTELAWITRRAPFGKARLIDTGMIVDFTKETTANDIVTVIATRPLTGNEKWSVMEKGSLIVFKNGEAVF